MIREESYDYGSSRAVVIAYRFSTYRHAVTYNGRRSNTRKKAKAILLLKEWMRDRPGHKITLRNARTVK